MAKVIYERKKGESLPEGYIDGMQSVMEEYDFQPTEFTTSENPPLGFWLGCHTRDGRRVPGFTEEKYREGEENGTVQRDKDGKPIYTERTPK